MSRKSRTEIQFFTNKKLQTPPLPKLPPFQANSPQALDDRREGHYRAIILEAVEWFEMAFSSAR
jgi:hypothetical protein